MGLSHREARRRRTPLQRAQEPTFHGNPAIQRDMVAAQMVRRDARAETPPQITPDAESRRGRPSSS